MIQIQDSPTDLVTSLTFSSGNQLLTTSWDDQIRLFDCESAKLITNIRTPSTPLSSAFKNGTFYSGFVDGNVRCVDLENQSFNIVCSSVGDGHSVGVSHLIDQYQDSNNIISGSWNGQINTIDTRLNKLVSTTKLSRKVFAMDASDNYLVVGMELRTINIYDHRNYQTPVQVRESGLKFQVKDLKCWAGGYALASIDGRVALEYFDPSESVQAKKFAFKCHRVIGEQEDEVWPVNSIQFGGSSGELLFTGGNDTVCLWNIDNRKRVKQYKVEREVNKICVSKEYLAISTAQKENEGENDTGYSFCGESSSKLFIKPLVR